MSKRAFYIAILISALLAVNSFISYVVRARRYSERIFESAVQPPTSQKGYDISRKTNLYAIQSALERYRLDHNQYPRSIKELQGIYLVEIPNDPVTKESYMYNFIDSKRYTLSARMDDGSLYTVTSP